VLTYLDLHFFILLLCIRRRPRSPLFPYTTLFRSSAQLRREARFGLRRQHHDAVGRFGRSTHFARHGRRPGVVDVLLDHDVGVVRSEEHTSELQSLAYLVCRLLLEKKKLTANLSTR